MSWAALQDVRGLLEAIPYGTNEVYLHTDEALMPRNHTTWASWNCIGSSDPSANTQAVCVTYWLNNLQVCPHSSERCSIHGKGVLTGSMRCAPSSLA